MLVELRRYSILPGRIDRMHTRMREVLLPMFAEHGIPRPFAIWDSVQPDGSGLLSWMLRWESFEHRRAAWDHFKPLFTKVRLAQGGEEFVTRTDLTLVEEWPTAPFAFPVGAQAGETGWLAHPFIGQQLGFRNSCLEGLFPWLRDNGATATAGFDFLFGSLPKAMVLVSWPDAATRERGAQLMAESIAAPAMSTAIGAGKLGNTGAWHRLQRAPYLGGW